MPEIKLGIAGATGRMGRAIRAETATDGRFNIAGTSDRDGDAETLFEAADLVLDFSVAGAAMTHAGLAGKTGKALLVGTTGLSDETIAALRAAASTAAVLVAPNTSVGIALLASFAREAAAQLGEDFRIEIEDIHHADKKDAPSGTALMLGRVISEARGIGLDDLAITAERIGDAAGKHRVSFIGALERIDLIHQVTDRQVFARGALDAGHWLVGQPPGFYAMSDFLGAAKK